MKTRTVRDKCVMQEFAEYVQEHGASFAWGRLSAPYDGCFYLNVVAFIKDGYAYLAADLQSFSGYRGHVVEPPGNLKTNKYLKAGCIPADDLRDVLNDVELHPIAELCENTPYQNYGAILDMADMLGIDVGDQFKCKLCGTPFAAGDDPQYFEGDFKGNGGIGIEVGEPVCESCFSEHHCGYCGAEVPPEHQGVDEDHEHCIYCVKATCPECGEDIRLDWGSEDEIKAYRELQCCAECYDEVKERKEREEKDARIASHTGDLFEKQRNE